MIPYTQSVASQEVPPPYHFPGVTVNGFVWEAHLDRVQQYCDTFLNLGDERDRGFSYGPAPAWPYAVMLVLDYILAEHGPTIYNQALADARAFLEERVADVEGLGFAQEFPSLKAPKRSTS